MVFCTTACHRLDNSLSKQWKTYKMRRPTDNQNQAVKLSCVWSKPQRDWATKTKHTNALHYNGSEKRVKIYKMLWTCWTCEWVSGIMQKGNEVSKWKRQRVSVASIWTAKSVKFFNPPNKSKEFSTLFLLIF